MAFRLDNIQKNTVRKEKLFNIEELLKKEISLFGNSFSNKNKEAFYTELSVLLNAGLELKNGLDLLANEQKKEHHKNMFLAIIEELVSGKNFSDAVKTQKSFTEYEYYSLQIGERTGTLRDVTEELGEFFKRKNEQRRAILNALSYPIVVLSTAFLAILFMLQFVVPMFADIFKQNKAELPWITQQIIGLSTAFKHNHWILLTFILMFIIFTSVFKSKLWYKKYTSSILLKIPFIGEFTRKVRIAQFTQAITLLTGAKIPLLNGIQLTKKMVDFYPLQQALEKVEEDILQGKSLYESIDKQGIFDKKMVSLIKVADETNQNETIFKRLTYQYNQEIAYTSKQLSSILEPIIILLLGAIVAIILIAMYLPMFKLSTVIG